jgi:hypothetical protein
MRTYYLCVRFPRDPRASYADDFTSGEDLEDSRDTLTTIICQRLAVSINFMPLECGMETKRVTRMVKKTKGSSVALLCLSFFDCEGTSAH